jgi:hypothetical protein
MLCERIMTSDSEGPVPGLPSVSNALDNPDVREKSLSIADEWLNSHFPNVDLLQPLKLSTDPK